MTARPYAVMYRPDAGAAIAWEPFSPRATWEALGYDFIADHPGYHPAAERAAEFNALPAEERWWAASWASRAREGAGA